MKTALRNTLLLTALFAGMSVFTASAQSPGNKGGPMTPITSRAEAEKVPAEAAVMLACGGCQTIQVVKPGGILGLFTPGTKHVCPGCKGEVTQVGAPGKSQSGLKYTHTCSKCGDASAYVCADHRG